MSDPSPELSAEDEAWLERAAVLARKGWGGVHPNPMVGCVIVHDGDVVGEGYHERFGGPHAEVVALQAAKSRAEGSTVYVSLEPCNHHGKTPPCADALLRAGVARVVYGAADPGSTSGGGGATLASAGVAVSGPVWPAERSRAENPAFHHLARHETPYIALKLAMSLDARIAASPGERTRITGPEADREVHRLRTGFDAVMVGAGTVRADDPSLTVRHVEAGRVPPRRLLLVPDAKIPEGASVLAEPGDAPVHVFCSEDVPETRIQGLESRGAAVHPVPAGALGLNLGVVFDRCMEVGIQSIFCEGGATLAASLLREGRVQRLMLLIAPTTLGEGALPAFPPDARSLDWTDFEPAGAPVLFGRDTLVVLDRQER